MKYIIQKTLCKNAIISIYKGIDPIHKKSVIIKRQQNDNKKYSTKSLVDAEWKILDKLREVDGIPKIVDYYKDCINNYLILDYLGKDLEGIQKENENKFSLGFCAFFMTELLTILSDIHENNIFHCDLKPSNFIFNFKESKIFLIDFSVSQIKGTKNTSIVGTPKFCSFYCHDCLHYSCRDDLISLGYVALYFFLGYLPWQKNKMRSLCTLNKIKEYKGELLTFLKNNPEIPEEFIIYFNYCYSLQINSEPEYIILRNLFVKMMNNNNYTKKTLENEIKLFVFKGKQNNINNLCRSLLYLS